MQPSVREPMAIMGGRRVRRRRYVCGGCGRGCYHLYRRADALLCRRCARVRCRHPRDRLFKRIERLRLKLGLPPYPAPLPPPPPWSRRRWYLTVAEIARLETALAASFEAEDESLADRVFLWKVWGVARIVR